MSEIESTYEAPPLSPDPFVLAKDVRGKVKTCCGQSHGAEKVEYLWIHASKDGIGQGCTPTAASGSPTVEHWLNVIDEAASLGAKWLMITLHSAIAESLDAMALAQWAQTAHGMGVAVHTCAKSLGDADLKALKALDLERLRLFVNAEVFDEMKPLEKHGIRVRVAAPQGKPKGSWSGCGMPQNLLYANASGELYTCGMVNGNKDFSLGNIYSRPFGSVVADPCLQHSIPMETPFEEHGCDGCPPLLSNMLNER